ncbi:MAG: ion transporter [Bacteroidia bacterium]
MAPRRSIKDRYYPELKEKWHDIIFHSDTKEGRRFDILLLYAILLSVLVVMADSVPSIQTKYSLLLDVAEWVFTIVFTIEYIMRIYISDKPKKYILSFWGIIDLLATIPTYLSLIVAGPQFLLMIRVFRLLRVFRVLRLRSFMVEAQTLANAIQRSGAKITVFFVTVLIVVIVMGTIMYVIEPPEAGFSSIPRSVYWAIVTLTTVGYGDITPVTALGQFLSAMLMILGYAVIAVPTGIVSVEFSQSKQLVECLNCGNVHNDKDAIYCKSCGNNLKHRRDSLKSDATDGGDSSNNKTG